MSGEGESELDAILGIGQPIATKRRLAQELAAPWFHQGYMARILRIECCSCGTEVDELLGVYTIETRGGSRRLTKAKQWPQQGPWPIEIEKRTVLHCAYCIESLGFHGTVFEIVDPFESLEGKPSEVVLEADPHLIDDDASSGEADGEAVPETDEGEEDAETPE